MKRTTLTGKNIPRLSVARGGWPERPLIAPVEYISKEEALRRWPTKKAIEERIETLAVFDDMGLKLRDEK